MKRQGEYLSLADTARIVGNTKVNRNANLLSKPMYNVHIGHTSHKSGGLSKYAITSTNFNLYILVSFHYFLKKFRDFQSKVTGICYRAFVFDVYFLCIHFSV